MFKDLSSRQKIRTTNDIFEMISENDEDIKFDECGIIKVVTQSKTTMVCWIEFSDKKNWIDLFFRQMMIIFIHLHLKYLQLLLTIIVYF